MSGRLSFTEDGCPTVSDNAVVWPAGFSSEVEPDGEQVVLTADGRTIHAGDIVTAGGGSLPRPTSGQAHRMPCTPGTGDLFYIMSPVRITQAH